MFSFVRPDEFRDTGESKYLVYVLRELVQRVDEAGARTAPAAPP